MSNLLQMKPVRSRARDLARQAITQYRAGKVKTVVAGDRERQLAGLTQRDVDERGADWAARSDTTNARFARLLGRDDR